jgi:hypothetical protein
MYGASSWNSQRTEGDAEECIRSAWQGEAAKPKAVNSELKVIHLDRCFVPRTTIIVPAQMVKIKNGKLKVLDEAEYEVDHVTGDGTVGTIASHALPQKSKIKIISRFQALELGVNGL